MRAMRHRRIGRAPLRILIASLILASALTGALAAQASGGGPAERRATVTLTVRVATEAGGSGKIVGVLTSSGTQVINCPGDCIETIEQDSDTISLTGQPSAGSTFEWRDACEGEDADRPCVFSGSSSGVLGGLFTGSGDPGPGPPPTDTAPPQTAFTAKPPHLVRRAKLPARVTFAFRSNEAGSTFQCSLDGAPFHACTAPKVLTLKAGRHRFRVRAVDKAGNKDSTPAAYSFRVIRRA